MISVVFDSHSVCLPSHFFLVFTIRTFQYFSSSYNPNYLENSSFSLIYLEPVTIIESTWPENLFSFQSRVFPNDLSHAKTPCDCNGILQACQTAVDRHNSFLWLIDNGSVYCAPKLVVYDLIRGNIQVIYSLHTIQNRCLKSYFLYFFLAGTSLRIR